MIKIDLVKTALIVIDMQNDFTEKGAILEIPNIRNIFPKLKKFINVCRNKGVSIIYTRHTYSPEGNPIETLLFPEMAEGCLRKNMRGWEINEYLNPAAKDVIINKTRYDAFYKTNLEEVLERKGITDVLIVGTMTEVCCESTARSAMFRDYQVWMLSDLNFTVDKKNHNNTLKIFSSNFGWIIESKQILELLK